MRTALFRRLSCLGLGLVCWSGLLGRALAEVTLPKLFSDHMVLQRDTPIHIWGTAAEGETVHVSFQGEEKDTVANSFGRWEFYLKPAKAGGPYSLTVVGKNAITLQDVLVGDVWIASGQSNMEFPMSRVRDSEKEIAAANVPEVRLLLVDKVSSDYALADISAKPWSRCTPEAVKDFSAVAYFFAREIQQKEHVPVGVIESSWGGTVAEAWTSLAAISKDASLMPVLAAFADMTDKEVTNRLQERQERKLIEEAKTAGRPAPKFPWKAPVNMWKPGALYNGMIAPLTPFPLKGVIWYQGESNSALNRTQLYQRLFPTLIQDWRSRWGIGDFPFLFVQISNYISTPLEDWPTIREAQRKTLSLRNTAMAVTIDIGNPDDVHPTNKQDVGGRLALAARATVYNEPVEYSGPLYRTAAREGKTMRLWFDHVGGGLIAKDSSLSGFEVAGADGKFVPAQARIDGETIVVSSDQVSAPAAVRYGWENSPKAALFNKRGLPASPFTTQN